MRRATRPLSITAALCTVLALGVACGDDGGSTEPKTIEITVDGDDVTPSGETVDVSTGQPIELVVTADAPGEIHVHSDPEHEFEYEGTGEPETLDIFEVDRPGSVEVESHTLEKLIVKLEVK